MTTPELDAPDPSPTVLALAQALAARDGHGRVFTSTTRSESSAEIASKYIQEAQDIAVHLPAPTVKPGREDVAREVARVVRMHAPRLVEFQADPPIRKHYDITDAVLAILPGKTIAQVRAEALRDAADALAKRNFLLPRGHAPMPVLVDYLRVLADEEAGR